MGGGVNMSHALFGSEGRLVKIRAAEDLRWAEQRRLQREALASRTGGQHRSSLWLLSRIAGLVVTWGERIRHIALKPAHLKAVKAKKGGVR